MRHAYLLINCDGGSENEVIDQLKHLNSVKEVQGTLGTYDIVTKIELDKAEILNDKVTKQIRKLHHIMSTHTLIDIDEEEEKLAEIIPDVLPEEKKPLEHPRESNEDQEEDVDEEYD